MPKKRLPMRKIREVLRLKYQHNLSNREIAKACQAGKSTIGEYLQRAKAAGITWPVPENLDDQALEALLFPPAPPEPDARPEPDWSEVHKELKRKGVTLFLLWNEYRQENTNAYQYSWFAKHYREWLGTVDVVMRQDHKAGEKLFVDYAGLTLGITNPGSGEIREAQVFVAVLGASNLTFAHVTPSQSLPDWLASHRLALEFIGGAPEIIVPDNLKAGVSKPCYYEPVINPAYAEFAAHYQVAVVPARVRKPRDKAKVEVAVQIIERQVLAPLRKCTFFSESEANHAVIERLKALNERPFQKLPGSRWSLFESIERDALRPLPARPYVFANWKRAKVGIDYHVELDGHYYSVPYRFAHERVDVRTTPTTIEVFFRGARIASHPRPLSPRKGGHTTIREHMPKAHQRHGDWSPARLRRWASSTGSATAELVEEILARRPHPEQGYRSCLGIFRLGKSYGHDRLEAACVRAVRMGAFSYQSVKSILKNNLDQQDVPELNNDHPVTEVEHANLRGATYYQNPQEERKP